jgi:hypothetical protein
MPLAHIGRGRRSVQKEGEILDTAHTNLSTSIHWIPSETGPPKYSFRLTLRQ